MAHLLDLDELTEPSAAPQPAVASGSGQPQSGSLLDADPHDSSAWAQPFAQWNSMMILEPPQQTAVRLRLSPSVHICSAPPVSVPVYFLLCFRPSPLPR